MSSPSQYSIDPYCIYYIPLLSLRYLCSRYLLTRDFSPSPHKHSKKNCLLFRFPQHIIPPFSGKDSSINRFCHNGFQLWFVWRKNTGGTFGFGRGELSSSDGTSRLGRGNGSLSFEQPASSAESSSNNSTNFGSSSVRRSSSSFRFANFASINRANSTSQEDKKDAKDPRQGSASNPGSLHDLNFNLSKSVFTTLLHKLHRLILPSSANYQISKMASRLQISKTSHFKLINSNCRISTWH